MSSYIPSKNWEEEYLQELKAVLSSVESREREKFNKGVPIFSSDYTDEDISVYRFAHQTVIPIWESCLFALKNDPFSFLYDYGGLSLPNYPLSVIFNQISQLSSLGKYRLTQYFSDVDDSVLVELTDAIFSNDSIRFQQIADENNLDVLDFRKRITSAIVTAEELDSVYSNIYDKVSNIEIFENWANADEAITELNHSFKEFPKANSRIIEKIQGYLKEQLREYDYDLFEEKIAKLTGLNITGCSGFTFLFLSYTVSLFLLLMPKMEQKAVFAIKDFLLESETRPILKGILRLLYIISKDDCQSEIVHQPEYFHFRTMSGPFFDFIGEVGMDLFVMELGPTREELERLGIPSGREQQIQRPTVPSPVDKDSREEGKPKMKSNAGAKPKSWLKVSMSEDVIKQKLEEEVWNGIKEDLDALDYLNKTGINKDKVQNAFGAAFIYYSAYSLGLTYKKKYSKSAERAFSFLPGPRTSVNAYLDKLNKWYATLYEAQISQKGNIDKNTFKQWKSIDKFKAGFIINNCLKFDPLFNKTKFLLGKAFRIKTGIELEKPDISSDPVLGGAIRYDDNVEIKDDGHQIKTGLPLSYSDDKQKVE